MNKTLALMIRTKATFRLTGVSHCADTVAGLSEGQPVRLTPQPDNEHDPNAIRATTLAGEPLGWVPAPLAARLAGEGLPGPVMAHVSALRTYEGRTVGADIVLDDLVTAAA